MIIGILTDGDGELLALPVLLKKTTSPHTCVRVLKTSLQFNTRQDNIVACVRKGMLQLRELDAQGVIVVLDREVSELCSGELAQTIRNKLVESYGNEFDLIEVVIKNRMLENWLIADPAAIDSQPARFKLSKGAHSAAERGIADNIDALGELRRAAVKVDYSKTLDAQRIAQRANPSRMGIGSRSFRRMLRVWGEPTYRDQSRTGAPANPRH